MQGYQPRFVVAAKEAGAADTAIAATTRYKSTADD
jgi:hypothetical protein